MNINDAKKSGAMALFGEKYSDEVRVLSFGEFSKELCGGTHVTNTSEIGVFMITKESGVSAGVRRIEAICSIEVLKATHTLQNQLSEIQNTLKTVAPLTAIEKLKDEIKELKSQIKTVSSSKKLTIDECNGIKVIVSEFDGDIKEKIDEIKNQYDKVVILLGNIKDDKVNLAAGVKNASLNANELIKGVAKIINGGGGGRPDFATAGGKNIDKIEESFDFAKNYIKEKLS